MLQQTEGGKVRAQQNLYTALYRTIYGIVKKCQIHTQHTHNT